MTGKEPGSDHEGLVLHVEELGFDPKLEELIVHFTFHLIN